MDMQNKKAALHSLGCKVNSYETEAMKQLLEEAGYEIVPFAPGADIYIINTCTVTNIADRKSRQMLHKAKAMNPDAIVVAAGCYVQTGKEALCSDEAVDLVIGNNCKQNIAEAIQEYQADHRKQERYVSLGKGSPYEELYLHQPGDHVRSFIKISDGCNQFCSYCLIPYARGRVRSRKPEDILEEIRVLTGKGCKEVVLTGIHVSSYGTDFEKGQETSLISLIEAVCEIDTVERVRLSSLEPRIVTEEFAERLASLPELCPHFHLSLQSGCDATLARMNRRYTSQEYAEKVRLLRKVFDHPSLTTDVIVGFPGETTEEFQESYDFIKQIRFYETHIFKYSRRDGTRAASMPGQIREAKKGERSDLLLALNQTRIHEFEEEMIGKKVSVLFEEEKRIGDEIFLIGHSKEYVPAAMPKTDGLCVNQIIEAQVQGFLGEHLLLVE